MPKIKHTYKGRIFSTNAEGQGIFELIGGSYIQHRGTGQTPLIKDVKQLARYLSKMFNLDRR